MCLRVRVCACARARDSVFMCCKCGVVRRTSAIVSDVERHQTSRQQREQKCTQKAKRKTILK
jgi:hypothetical protein